MKCNSLSASRDKSHNICEFKYYLDYHLCIEQQKKFATEQGSFCHDIYELLGKAKKKGISRPKILKRWIDMLTNAYNKSRKIVNRVGNEEVIPALWTLSKKALERNKKCDTCPYFNDGTCWVTGKDISKFEGCPKNEFDESQWLIEKVLEDESELNPINKKILDVEKSFEIKIPTGRKDEIAVVRGFIDLVIELDKSTIEIVDYKTGRDQSYSECLEDPQLLYYHYAVRQLYPQYKHVFVTLWYIKHRMMTVAFGPEDEEKTKQRIIRKFITIRETQWPRRRCDRYNGLVWFDWRCNCFCNPTLCQKEYEEMIKIGKMKNAT
jgi:hypothetical protein